MKQNKIVGITGVTGSGTSTVAKILKQQGGFIIEADKLAHELMQKGEPTYAEIVKTFGAEILNVEGEINRRALGAMVFGSGNEQRLAELEGIIHPNVIEKTKHLLNFSANGGYSFAAIDAPLLIESGMNNLCTTVWLIIATDSTRLKRIQARDKITAEAARLRLKSRPSDTDKTLSTHTNIIIENNSTLADLQEKVYDACRKEALYTNFRKERQ